MEDNKNLNSEDVHFKMSIEFRKEDIGKVFSVEEYAINLKEKLLVHINDKLKVNYEPKEDGAILITWYLPKERK